MLKEYVRPSLDRENVGVLAKIVLVGVEENVLSSVSVGVADCLVTLASSVTLPNVGVPALRVLEASLEGDGDADTDTVASVREMLEDTDDEGDRLYDVDNEVSLADTVLDMDRASGENEMDGDATVREMEVDSVNSPV